MKLVDVHAHLTFDEFKENLSEVLARAKRAGVEMIIVSGIGPKSNREALDLMKKHPKIIKCSFGIYPVDAVAKLLKEGKDDVQRELEIFDVGEELGWIKEHKEECVAIGEVGLDYKMVVEEEAREEQRNILKRIIELAKEIDKPLVIHSRGGEEDVLRILEENNFSNADMHCFTASKKLIKKGVEQGLYFSIPAVITRLEHFKMLAEIVPIEQLLTETDCPYLTPEVGRRSEPMDVKYTIKEIARIKNLSEEEVARRIRENAKKLFKV